MFKSVFKNTTSQILSQVVSSGTGFLITILIARYYSLSGYSNLAKITDLVGLFYLGIDLGANAIFLQLEEKQKNFSRFLSFRLSLALFVFLLMGIVVAFLPYNSILTSGYPPVVKLGILLFSLSFFTRAIVYTCGAFFQQDLTYHNALFATLGSEIATLTIVILSVLFQLPLLWIIVAYLLGGCIEAIMSLILLREKFTITFHFPFFSKLFLATLPMTILLFLNLLYFRMDMILLALYQKSSAVGLYDYAYRYFDFLIALPLFLSNSLYPHLLKLEKNSRILIKNVAVYTISFFIIGVIFIPIVWILSPLIVLVKQDFLPSVLPLRLLTLSLPIFFATNILQWIFITKKKQKFLVFVYGASLILNVILNFIYIPHYSYIASAVITGFSELFVLVIMVSYLIFSNL